MKRTRRRLPRLLRFLMTLIRLLTIPFANFHHLMLTSIKYLYEAAKLKNGSACTSITRATKVLHPKQSFNFKHLCSSFNHLMKLLPIKYLLLCACYFIFRLLFSFVLCFLFFFNLLKEFFLLPKFTTIFLKTSSCLMHMINKLVLKFILCTWWLIYFYV